MTVKEVADLLRVCTATVYKLADKGDVPHTRVLNSIRFRRGDIAAYLRERTERSGNFVSRSLG
jgi:excisionase family DNA binding protein